MLGQFGPQSDFPMRAATKSSIYRNEVTAAAIRAVRSAVELAESPDFVPAFVDYSNPQVFRTFAPIDDPIGSQVKLVGIFG